MPILRELLRTRSVTQAAAALHMSQPAVSEALGRLRAQFEDAILVRVGRGMVATRFAEFWPHIEQALAQLQTVFKLHEFDLKHVERELIVATADTIILAIGSQLAESADPKALHAEINARIESARGPIGPLSRFQMEEMIDPRDTRGWVCEWVENAYRIVSQPGLLVPGALQFRHSPSCTT
ncbi:MAG: LysR family transcriptional regulator [Candidatus Binatus sp.]|uniref:helix-turn-helix domain-containing protein n=1 Tax=Candidatus Binatus sp. TaxID=2811406 RepID=UPI0027162F7E|nr:LysR family transcriptional regulator [Candidatus Binatus sp.]MDO8433745.1 LysR family transcriptional regulator [Candidatus Binatus sp.]